MDRSLSLEKRFCNKRMAFSIEVEVAPNVEGSNRLDGFFCKESRKGVVKSFAALTAEPLPDFHLPGVEVVIKYLARPGINSDRHFDMVELEQAMKRSHHL